MEALERSCGDIGLQGAKGWALPTGCRASCKGVVGLTDGIERVTVFVRQCAGCYGSKATDGSLQVQSAMTPREVRGTDRESLGWGWVSFIKGAGE